MIKDIDWRKENWGLPPYCLDEKRSLGYNTIASDNLSDLRLKPQALDGLDSAYKRLGQDGG